MIIASDGIWDALSSDMAAKSCRGLPAELAAKLVVKVMSKMPNFPTGMSDFTKFCIKICSFHLLGGSKVERSEG